MIVSGRAITLPTGWRRAAVALLLCALMVEAPARAQIYSGPQATAGPAKRPPPIAQSGAQPRPFPSFRPVPLPYPVEPLPPAPPPRPRASAMPNVTGMPLGVAEAVLARQGLKPSEVAPIASTAPANWVVAQQPFPQQSVSEGARIVLSVSDGAMARVPDLRGLTPRQAGQILRASGLSLGRQSEAVSDLRPPGRIVATRPGPGAQTQRGAEIDYEIAGMPPPPPPPPVAVVPPPRPPPSPPSQSDGGPGQPPRPVKPTPVRPAPVAPTRPPPVRPIPASSAPASSTPESSAAPEAASASPASASPASAPPPAPIPPPPLGSPATMGPLGWAEGHPGWLAALAAVLAAGAVAGGWSLRRRPVLPTPANIPILPVTVTASMLAVPGSTIENAQPATGPAIGIAWRLDPPETRLESAKPEEPSP